MVGLLVYLSKFRFSYSKNSSFFCVHFLVKLLNGNLIVSRCGVRLEETVFSFGITGIWAKWSFIFNRTSGSKHLKQIIDCESLYSLFSLIHFINRFFSLVIYLYYLFIVLNYFSTFKFSIYVQLLFFLTLLWHINARLFIVFFFIFSV